MKRHLLKRVALLILTTSIYFVSTACDQFTSFTYQISGCTTTLSWQYTECASGTYSILYSTDGSNFYVIGQKPATGATSYSYTDNAVVTNSSSKTYYEIRYVSSSNLSVYSSILQLTLSGCSTNMSSRCSGISSLTLNGADAICSNSTQTYSLTPSYLATWTLAGNTNMVSSTVGTTYGSPTISNSSNTGKISLNANVYGCKDVSKAIAIGPYVVGYYTITANSWGSPGYQFDLTGGAAVLLAKNDNATFICHVTNSNLSNISWSYAGYTPTSYSIGNGGLGLTFAMNVPSTSYASNTTNWTITSNSTCGNVNITIPFTVTANGGFTTTKGNTGLTPNDLERNLVNEKNRLVTIPNPVYTDEVHIVMFTASKTINLRIIGLSGNVLQEQKRVFPDKGIQSFMLPLGHLTNGIYVIEVLDQGLRYYKQIFKAGN